MALISVKNFMTPFTNKVHFGTLLFVLALFITFRAAGGAISFRTPLNSEKRQNYSAPKDLPLDEPPSSLDDIDPRSELKRLGIEPRKDNRQREDLLGSMGAAPGSQQKNANQGQAKGSEGGDLSDIERRLGLR